MTVLISYDHAHETLWVDNNVPSSFSKQMEGEIELKTGVTVFGIDKEGVF